MTAHRDAAEEAKRREALEANTVSINVSFGKIGITTDGAREGMGEKGNWVVVSA